MSVYDQALVIFKFIGGGAVHIRRRVLLQIQPHIKNIRDDPEAEASPKLDPATVMLDDPVAAWLLCTSDELIDPSCDMV